jgi:hypothetical protein
LEGILMMRGIVGMLVTAAAMLTLVTLGTTQQQDKTKSQDAQPAGATEVTAKVVKLDTAKSILTVDDAGKQREFKVTEETKIVGPRGAASKERLKDERFAPGWELNLIVAADGKQLLQIRLPLRKEKKADKE